MPLVAPGIVVSWILCLAFSWNEFLFAFATTQSEARPMSVMLVGAEQTRGVDFQFVGTRMDVWPGCRVLRRSSCNGTSCVDSPSAP